MSERRAQRATKMEHMHNIFQAFANPLRKLFAEYIPQRNIFCKAFANSMQTYENGTNVAHGSHMLK